jgi:hypothetical protein
MSPYGLDMSGIFARPPLKPTGRKPFMADPESPAVIGKNFNGGSACITRNTIIGAVRMAMKRTWVGMILLGNLPEMLFSSRFRMKEKKAKVGKIGRDGIRKADGESL